MNKHGEVISEEGNNNFVYKTKLFNESLSSSSLKSPPV